MAWLLTSLANPAESVRNIIFIQIFLVKGSAVTTPICFIHVSHYLYACPARCGRQLAYRRTLIESGLQNKTPSRLSFPAKAVQSVCRRWAGGYGHPGFITECSKVESRADLTPPFRRAISATGCEHFGLLGCKKVKPPPGLFFTREGV